MHLGLSDYTVYRKDRSGGTDPHGGVLIALKSNVNHSPVNYNTNREIMGVDIITSQGNRFRFIAAYRPGSYDEEKNIFFMQDLYSLPNDQEKTCVFGDLNLPDICWENYTSVSGMSGNLPFGSFQQSSLLSPALITSWNTILSNMLTCQQEVIIYWTCA